MRRPMSVQNVVKPHRTLALLDVALRDTQREDSMKT